MLTSSILDNRILLNQNEDTNKNKDKCRPYEYDNYNENEIMIGKWDNNCDNAVIYIRIQPANTYFH